MAVRSQAGGNLWDLNGYILTASLWQPNTYARNANNEGFTLPKGMKFTHTPLHLVSLDERRKEFAVTDLQRALQVGFKGVHANVGGGYGGSLFEFIAREFVYEYSKKAGLSLWDEEDFKMLGAQYRATYERYMSDFRDANGNRLLPLLTETATDNSRGYFNDDEYRHLPQGMLLHPSVAWFSERPTNPIYRVEQLKSGVFTVFRSRQVLIYPYLNE